MKEQKITIPEGFKLEKVSETEYKVVPTEKKLPKTWEEFCEMNPLREGEYWVDNFAKIAFIDVAAGSERTEEWYNLLPSKEKAEAILALCQLIQLRDCYNDGWKPEFKTHPKDCVFLGRNDNWDTGKVGSPELFAFKTEFLAKSFLKNFKDLLGKLKPLYQ